MSRTHKGSKVDSLDLRQKLTADFVAALQADWDEHKKEIIEARRTRAPTKYAEIITRLVMPDPMPAPGDFSACKTQEDIGRLLLLQVGVAETAMTPSMIEAAVAANDDFIARLDRIAGGH